MTSYLDTRLGNLSRTGPFVQSLGQFNTLAELIAGHPANNYLPGTMAYTVDAGQMISDGSQWLNLGTTIPGEVELKVATYAKARLVSGVTTGDILYVLGRTTQSDGGQGLFTWVAGGTTTINDGSQLSAPGGIWQRPDVTINAQWYGIDPTGVTASDVALNLAIQDAIIQKKKLVLPSGIFLLNAPLMCFKAGANFAKIEIEGQGSALPGSVGFPTLPQASYQPNTLLCMNSKVVPAIIFQANRYSSLKNLAIQGLNTTAFQGNAPSPPTDNRADYIVAGCPTGFQSPYCAIAIDPFPAAAPTDGGYAGLGAFYGPAPSGTGSSGIIFENVAISEFVVGIAVSTAGVLQGDNMIFRNVNVGNCETGYACGNAQSRGCYFQGYFSFLRQAFDIINYGQTANTGCNPLTIENTLFLQMYRLLALGQSEACEIKGCYAESFKTLGQCGTSTGFSGLAFVGCDFFIRDSWGSIPPMFFESSNSAVFKGCRLISDAGSRDVWNIYGDNTPVGLEQCTLTGTARTDVLPYIGVDLNSQHPVRTVDCWMRSAGAGSFLVSDDYTRAYAIAQCANGKGRLRATQQTRWITDGNTQYLYQPAAATPVVTISTVAASIAIVSTTLTFQEATLGELQVNDILIWLMLAQGYSTLTTTPPAWKIASIDGSGNCVANALWDIAQYDTVANAAAVFAANKVVVCRQQWAPTTALTGNTHSNTTLDGLSSNSLINGDFVQGVGIPVRTRVVSGGGTASVVLSKAATSTLTGINIYDGQLVGAQQSGIYFPTQAGNTGAAPVPTFALGAVQAWTLNASTTWGAPTGAWVTGNRLTLLVTSTGAFTTAWNAVYRNAPAWAVAANGQKATAEFMYDGTNWQFIGGSAAFA